MKIVRYSLGILLAAFGGLFAFVGAMIAVSLPHVGPGLEQTVIGTPLSAIGAFAWGISFRFVPAGWPKLFFGLFLLPLVLYPLFLWGALDYYVSYQERYEVFWLAPFFVLSVSAWYWQIRRVTRSLSCSERATGK